MTDKMYSALAGAGTVGRCVKQRYRSNTHSQGLMDGLLALREGGILFDVVLIVEGKPVNAHRILLAASCDYFRGMFAGGLREMQQTEIPILGVTYTAMNKLLDFIYTSELELDLDTVQEVLCAATLLQVQDVIGFCCEFLFSWMDNDNILEVEKLADAYGLEQLGEKVRSYLLKNIQTFSRTPVYRQLPPEKVLHVLSSDELEVSSESEVFEAALHYYYSPEQVEKDQAPLQEPLHMMEAVRFCLMEQAALERLYGRLESSYLRNIISFALRYHNNKLWQPVMQSPLSQPRSNCHCILGFGGMFSTGVLADIGERFQVFRPSWDEWRNLGAEGAPRMSNMGIALLNNFVYLVGGDNNTSGFRAESRCWRYDPRHNTWCDIEPLRQQHADHCVCVVDDFIYAIGGRDYSSELDCVERYNPQTNTWEYVAPLKREVYAHAGAVVDGKIYIACGRRGMAYLKETYCYDPRANQWSACSEGPVERAWHGMAVSGGRAYVIGGSNDGCGYRRDVLKVACYNPAEDSWSVVSPLPAGHGEPGMAVLDGRIYVLGGRSHDKGSRMKYVHIYDPENDCWESGVSLDTRVSGLSACVALMPRSTLEQARGSTRQAKASWEEVDWGDSDHSSEDG
ncbi:kelch-like protein 22 [Tachysurus fulvidraco]|uniref:kelch-like protein 22 n=1 Tax=Tachysurus fulvidraco TaxID=1234273 RepID=UPI000F4EA95B|nr:kelch-like protein 22 [Tachysurus fulvidraco]XP_027023286.1 kelch-like protein 22 [Tachysurus fulvidraco]XP_027023287.1 kelch-like protein 22 [Tachysurus fulvidraco]XP_027023288.1 kelch-like protein 22 [Tachysurus fulvidraco]